MTTSQAGLYTEVLGFSVSPPGNTQYGTPRTFSATVVNVATTSTAQSYNGNISFVDGNGKTLCATTVTSDQTLVGAAVRRTADCLQLLMALWHICRTCEMSPQMTSID